MAKYIIEGGQKLKGSIKISGNKNSVLPCLSACLLTKDKVILKNIPQIHDVWVMLDLLKDIGADVRRMEDTVTIQAKKIKNTKLDENLVNKLRASILLIGPLLSRASKVTFYHPGGDVIGKRSINIHLQGLKELGFKFVVHDTEYKGFKEKEVELTEIFLDEASCTATENIILTSVLGKGRVILKNAAKEPQIVDLCQLLNSMGAKIEGVGDSTLVINRVPSLQGTSFNISPDYIEMTTYALAAALTKGAITLKSCSVENLEPVTSKLAKMGIHLVQKGSNIEVWYDNLVAIPKIHTNIWPGFPTDLMSVFIVLATQAKGVSLLHDWMYESRMFFVDKLISMGANITIADPHRVFIYGPTKLTARELETPDIRAGMALVIAGLIARGRSIINRAELIERGYSDIVGNLKSLGANIKRVD